MRRAASPDWTLRKVRTLCLSLPGVTEVEAWGHPNFRAGNRTFAAVEMVRGRPSLAVKVEDGFQDLLIDDARFFRTPYGGNRGWVSAWLDGEVDWALLKGLVTRAHRLVAPTRSPAAPNPAR